LATYLYVTQIIIAIVLIVAVLLQSKGSGFTGTFQEQGGIFRTRRGVEKLLFQITLVLAGLFIVVAIASVLATGQTVPEL
jgi:preprotein translocase subunit SecG